MLASNNIQYWSVALQQEAALKLDFLMITSKKIVISFLMSVYLFTILESVQKA